MSVTHSLWEPRPDPLVHAPEALYRLRLSVLADNEEHGDCLPKTFTFKTHAEITTASGTIDSVFGGAFSEYTIEKCGWDTPDFMGERLDGGVTENVVIKYDSQTADESWGEFLGRLGSAEKGWVVEG